MKRFKLTDAQAEAILETKLRHLARLEEMKIRGEQAELAERARRAREDAQVSKAQAAASWCATRSSPTPKKYGDDRRSQLVERAAAQAIDETELVASEPVTVVLSQSGWVRAAKGHDIDPRTLSYKTGDEFQAAARGRSTQQAVFLDSDRSCVQPARAHAAVGARAGRAAVRSSRSAGRRDVRRRADRRARRSLACSRATPATASSSSSRSCTAAIAPARRC